MDMDDVVHKHEQTCYAGFFEEVREEHPATFDGLAYFMPYFERGEPISDFFQSRTNGHYNARGDEVLSEGFYRDLMALDVECALIGTGKRPSESKAIP
jgi:hypothetical protein